MLAPKQQTPRQIFQSSSVSGCLYLNQESHSEPHLASVQDQADSYNVTGCRSWNCILVPGLTTVVPAVCPYCACRAVYAGPCGSTLPVFTATLRPLTSIEANSTLSGSDLRGLAREELIFPNTFAPARNTTFPLTETSCASFASKLLPTG